MLSLKCGVYTMCGKVALNTSPLFPFYTIATTPPNCLKIGLSNLPCEPFSRLDPYRGQGTEHPRLLSDEEQMPPTAAPSAS